MGHRMCQLLATLCVASSLALTALGGSDLPSEFHLRTLCFSRLLQPSRALLVTRFLYPLLQLAPCVRSRRGG
jgi:hypothetical protein